MATVTTVTSIPTLCGRCHTGCVGFAGTAPILPRVGAGRLRCAAPVVIGDGADGDGSGGGHDDDFVQFLLPASPGKGTQRQKCRGVKE